MWLRFKKTDISYSKMLPKFSWTWLQEETLQDRNNLLLFKANSPKFKAVLLKAVKIIVSIKITYH